MAGLTPIRILLPCPPRSSELAWGDYYFGHALGKCLEGLGLQVRYSYAPLKRLSRWKPLLRRIFAPHEIEFVLRGKKRHPRLPWKKAVMWIISCPDSVKRAELQSYSHVFVASDAYYSKIADQCHSASVLLQCTDADIFMPAPESVSDRILFVGNIRKNATRPVVWAALRAGFPLEVWGKGWKDRLPDDQYGGLHVANEALPAHYQKASVVLNDHTHAMYSEGFISNRVYDVLACGRPVVTEAMERMPQDILPGVVLYSSEDDVASAIGQAIKKGKADHNAQVSLAQHVRQHHSFKARAQVIFDTLNVLFNSRQSPPAA